MVDIYSMFVLHGRDTIRVNPWLHMADPADPWGHATRLVRINDYSDTMRRVDTGRPTPQTAGHGSGPGCTNLPAEFIPSADKAKRYLALQNDVAETFL